MIVNPSDLEGLPPWLIILFGITQLAAAASMIGLAIAGLKQRRP